MRVYDLARQLEITSKETLDLLARAGVNDKQASSGLSEPEEVAAKELFYRDRGIRVGDAASSIDMTQADLAALLSQKFDVSLSAGDVAAVLRRTTVPSEMLSPKLQDQAVIGLFEQGDLPEDAVAATDPETQPVNRRRAGSALVHVPAGDTREKTASDNDTLDWLNAVVKRDLEIANATKVFRPKFYESKRGDGIVYVDPMSEFLEPSEFNYSAVPVGTPGRTSSNWIFASLEKLDVWNADGAAFQWRSNELLNKFRKELFGLWFVHRYCRGCHDPLDSSILSDFVKEILRGQRVLPKDDRERGHRVFRSPEMHPWCRDLRRGRIRLEVALQDVDEVGEALEALRNQRLVEMATSVAQQNLQYGIDRTTVLRAFRKNLHVMKKTS